MPRIIGFTAIVVIALIVAASDSPAQRRDANEEIWDGIDAWNDALADAFDDRDVEAITALFTEDAVIIEPHHPGVRGRENIEAYFEYWLDFGIDEITSRTEEVYGDGDTAVEIGTSKAYYNGSLVSENRYMAVFKRAGDRWLVHRIMSTK